MTDAALQTAAWRERVGGVFKHLHLEQVRDGSWFHKLLERHAKSHKTVYSAAHWEARYPGLDAEERADKHTRKIAMKAAAAGAIASTGASAGELLSLLTEGLGAPIGLPAAAASMVVEGAYTTLLQLDLASDLASMYGVPFGDDMDEMATLFSIALGTDEKHEKKKPEGANGTPKGLLSKLMELEDTEVATHIGKKLLEEAVYRNIVPIVGIGISARWNYVATQKLAAQVRKYIRYRRALTSACHKLRLADVKNPEIFVRGAWLLASCDGEPAREEMMAISLVLEQFPDAERQLPAFDVDDEEAWFARVANIPNELDDRLIDLMCLVAAIDRDLVAAETRFLSRLGKTLHRKIDMGRVESLCNHLGDGDDLPDDFFAHMTVSTSIPAPAS